MRRFLPLAVWPVGANRFRIIANHPPGALRLIIDVLLYGPKCTVLPGSVLEPCRHIDRPRISSSHQRGAVTEKFTPPPPTLRNSANISSD